MSASVYSGFGMQFLKVLLLFVVLKFWLVGGSFLFLLNTSTIRTKDFGKIKVAVFFSSGRVYVCKVKTVESSQMTSIVMDMTD